MFMCRLEERWGKWDRDGGGRERERDRERESGVNMVGRRERLCAHAPAHEHMHEGETARQKENK